MSRTVRLHPWRTWWIHESKPARKTTRRLARRAQTTAIKTQRYDTIPRERGTEGWLTW